MNLWTRILNALKQHHWTSHLLLGELWSNQDFGCIQNFNMLSTDSTLAQQKTHLDIFKYEQCDIFSSHSQSLFILERVDRMIPRLKLSRLSWLQIWRRSEILKTRLVFVGEREKKKPRVTLFVADKHGVVFKGGDKSARFQRSALKKSFVQNRFLKTTTSVTLEAAC